MNTPGPPFVSIVTPVYNESEYLAECIESVLRQTYKNWEYIILDNCSTDASIGIARHFAQKDQRIRVYENPQFLMAICNHNVALRHISSASKYCKVVFADDWIFPECVERMVDVAEAHPTVGIVGSYALDGRQVLWTGLPYPGTLVPGHELCRRYFLERLYAFGTATSLLYRSDLVRSRTAFYNETNMHADTEACIELLKSCDFGFVHQVLAFSRVRKHSRAMLSRHMNTYAGSELHDLVIHGPAFLADEELRLCLRRHLIDYYRFLAGGVLCWRDKAFWGHHRKALVEAGVGFSRLRLARSVLARVCVAVLHAGGTIESLLRRREDEAETLVREIV